MALKEKRDYMSVMTKDKERKVKNRKEKERIRGTHYYASYHSYSK